MTTRYLALDASTYVGSAAIISESGALMAECEVAMRGVDHERLMPAVAALLQESQMQAADLAGVICGAGPGSFTSLRIAASIAKGITSGVGIPLFSVSSLLLIPASVDPPLPPGEYLALLDAMRGDFHTLRCVVQSDGLISAAGEMSLCSSAELSGVGGSSRVREIGPGRTLDVAPRARGAAKLLTGILHSGHVDINEWEPVYGRLAEAEVRRRAAAVSKG